MVKENVSLQMRARICVLNASSTLVETSVVLQYIALQEFR